MRASVRHPQEPQSWQTQLIRWWKQMPCLQLDQALKTRNGDHWFQIVLKAVYTCCFVCANLTLSPLSILDALATWAHLYVSVTCVSKVERCGVSKEFSVSEVSESRLFDSTPLWLGEFPLQFPSAEPMLGKESRARKIYVDVSNENTTIPPPRLTIFVKQRSVRSFSLSLRSLLSPWIFPFLLMYVSENLNSCWRGVSHFTWFVVSAGTLVTQLSIGLLRGWASLGVSLKV